MAPCLSSSSGVVPMRYLLLITTTHALIPLPTTLPPALDTLHGPFLEPYPSVTPSLAEEEPPFRRTFHHRRLQHIKELHASSPPRRNKTWHERGSSSKWFDSLQDLNHHTDYSSGQTAGGGTRWWVMDDSHTSITRPLPPSLLLASPAPPPPPVTRRHPPSHSKHKPRKPVGGGWTTTTPTTLPPTALPPTLPFALPPSSPMPSVPPPTPLAEDPAVLQAPHDLIYNNNRTPRWFTLDRLFRMLTVGADGDCVDRQGRQGQCMLQPHCRRVGGAPSSPCNFGYATCCIAYVSTCGSEVQGNRTYWVSPEPSASSVVTTGGTCALRVRKMSHSVCFIRLDLIDFQLMSPVEGSCTHDHLLVSGQNLNSLPPKLCGQNSGQHLYVDVDTVYGPVELSITTVGGSLTRRWEIKVSQIECNSPYRPPANCLQYYTGTHGTFSSFNYAPDANATYLNYLNYAICFRKEAGFCSIVYQNIPSTNERSFEIVNFQVDSTGTANPVVPTGEAGIGLIKCPDDYLIMAGTRLCGERLNDGSNPQPTNNGPITDVTNGPFIVQFITDGRFAGRGFQLFYQQYPC